MDWKDGRMNCTKAASVLSSQAMAIPLLSWYTLTSSHNSISCIGIIDLYYLLNMFFPVLFWLHHFRQSFPPKSIVSSRASGAGDWVPTKHLRAFVCSNKSKIIIAYTKLTVPVTLTLAVCFYTYCSKQEPPCR